MKKELYPVGVSLEKLSTLGVEIVAAARHFRSRGRAVHNRCCVSVGVDQEIAAFAQQNCGRSMRIMKICRKRGVRVVSRTKEPEDSMGKTC